MDCRILGKTEPVRIENEYGTYNLVLYSVLEGTTQTEHLALCRNLEATTRRKPILLRLNSACITSEVFHDQRCDCDWQLHHAMRLVDDEDAGLIIYHLAHEGRGLGLAAKLRSFRTMDQEEVSSPTACTKLGIDVDRRSYLPAVVILKELGISEVRLISNNPAKIQALESHSIRVSEVIPTVRNPSSYVEEFYMDSKVEELGHRMPRRQVMSTFADRLVDQIHKHGNPCVIGLDPRTDFMPTFIKAIAGKLAEDPSDATRLCIAEYHRRIVNLIADLVPAVKLQIAFYEQYGIPGMLAFQDTIEEAKKQGLLVIVDAKRNDIASTAQAYANALLGTTRFLDGSRPVFDVDCITVSPYLGTDSLEPFVETCREFGKGIFILVKTSNPGSADLQDLIVNLGGQEAPLYEAVADLVNRYAPGLVGSSGYSSIGAVVGATFPTQAEVLREKMPRSIFLVPGYGAQGAKGKDVTHCFNKDGLGAVVNASRSITYAFESLDLGEADFERSIRGRVTEMIEDINSALDER